MPRDGYRSTSLPTTFVEIVEDEAARKAKEFGVKSISIADMLVIAYTFYQQRRELPTYQKSARMVENERLRP